MSISQLYPDEGPTLNLNFAGSRILDPRITFTRSSRGTYVDSSGLIKIATADQPRFDHRYVNGQIESLGLLMEESRTNLLTYSEQFDNVNWGKGNAGITTNTTATTAPDGTISAEKLIEDTANAQHYTYQSRTGSNETLTFSVFCKAAERTKVFLQLSNFLDATAQATYDLSAGTAGTPNASNADYSNISTNIIPYPNGWYRCILTATKGSVNTTNNPAISTVDTSGNIFYTGNGSSGIYIWGAQLEQGYFPTSYIPTTTATATRTADNARMTGTNFSSWYNQSEGTLVTEGFSSQLNENTGPEFVCLSDSDGSGYIEIIGYQGAINLGIGNYTTFPNYDFTRIGITTISNNTNCKISAGYKLSDHAISINGNLVGTSSTTIPLGNMTTLGIGVWPFNEDYHLNGCLKSILYYPKRLTNDQLQTLTK